MLGTWLSFTWVILTAAPQRYNDLPHFTAEDSLHNPYKQKVTVSWTPKPAHYAAGHQAPLQTAWNELSESIPMSRWLGSIVFLWHHKITRVVFKGLILYLAFCLGEGKCKGTVHFFIQHLCHSFLPLYIYPLLQNTHHLSEFTNKESNVGHFHMEIDLWAGNTWA